ncbi:MAG: hypothetical protein A4E48_00993 [Methanosaeta sp. PtaU1.Bin060]|nr:MAG: hypothetical protein A4E48_00993 [Methanosaeta sp. PtaU1.Bin060]
MPTDWMLNFRSLQGRTTCHGDGDIVWGKNRDWARISGNAYLLQKLKIFLLIPKGEIINSPDLGCCLWSYQFDKLTASELVRMRLELLHDLQKQLPELGVQSVAVARNLQDRGAVDIQITSRTGDWIFNVNREDLADVGLTDVFNSI